MYLEIKVLHIISVVAWFAGLFYIFRLFVYHRQHSLDSHNAEIREMLCTMERRLQYMIIFPASAVTLLSGVAMLSLNPAFLEQRWLWLKLFAVCLLLIYQTFSYWTYLRFRRQDFFLSEKSCRFINEVPTVLLIMIVILVVIKP